MKETNIEKEAMKEFNKYIKKHGIENFLKFMKQRKDFRIKIFYENNVDKLKVIFNENDVNFCLQVYQGLFLNFDKDNKLISIEINEASLKFENLVHYKRLNIDNVLLF